MASTTSIFIAYAKADIEIVEELRKQLSVFERSGKAVIWYDGMLAAGENWEAKTQLALEQAHIILLLVSSDFIASDFCYNTLMKQAVARHEAATATVIPVIVRDCVWKPTPFGKIKELPFNGIPTTSAVWDKEQNNPYAEIARALGEKIATQNAKQEQREEVPTKPKSKRKQGRILYRIPQKMQQNVTSTCTIRIAPEDLPKEILKEYLNNANEAVVEDLRRIGDYMRVQLVDNTNAFKIETQSTEEQAIEEDDYSEWIYEVTPLVAGQHRLSLKVSISKLRTGVGKEYKDVVVLNKEIDIVTQAVTEQYDWAAVKQAKPLVLVHSQTGVGEEEDPDNSPPPPITPAQKPATKSLPIFRKYGRVISMFMLLVFLLPTVAWAAAPEVVTPIYLGVAYDETQALSDGRIAVKKDGKWGIVNKWGKQSIAPQFEAVQDSGNGITQVKKAGKWGAVQKVEKASDNWVQKVFNPKDQEIVPIVADTIETIENKKAKLQIDNKMRILPTL